MKDFTVSAKIGKDGDPVECQKEFGETIDELIEQFGEDPVYSAAMQALIVSLQSRMRSMMNPDREGGPATDEEIQEMVDEWQPGTRKPGKSKQEKITEEYKKLDPATRRAMLEALRKEVDAPVLKGAAKKKAAAEEEEEEEGEEEEEAPRRPAAKKAAGVKTAAKKVVGKTAAKAPARAAGRR